MRKIYLFLVLILAALTSQAQKYVPQIKEGTVLNYNVKARASGQTASIALTVKSLGNPYQITWNIPFVGTGSFELSAASVQSATKTLAEEPAADEVTRMKDDETLLILSKKTFADLATNKNFVLNGHTFTVKPDTGAFTVNNKILDVFYAVSGNREIRVLNDPDFPLICTAKKVTDYIDFQLMSFKE